MDPHLATASSKGVAESDEVTPEPPLPQAEQPQLFQPLLIGITLSNSNPSPASLPFSGLAPASEGVSCS